jgi:hypothetical protein
METFQQILSKRFKEQIKINDSNILLGNDLITRIKNFRLDKLTDDEKESKEFQEDVILERVKTDPLIRALFRKDPTRQSIHEKTQIDYIKQKYHDAYKPNNICFSNKKIHIMVKNKKPPNSTKTFDLHIPSEKIYGILKYTTSAGGSQDNQYADVKSFINHAMGYLSENEEAPEKFYFFLDGVYYSEKKQKELTDMITHKYLSKIVITSCEKL